jgi:hypothetical protein
MSMNPGVIFIGKSLFKFVTDTGATLSVISIEDARLLRRDVPECKLVAVESPITVITASGQELKVRHKLIAPATLTFKAGEVAELSRIELYVTKALRNGEVVLGKSTLRALGIDIDAMVTSTLLSRIASPVEKQAHAVAEERDCAFVAATRHVRVGDDGPVEKHQNLETRSGQYC